MILRIDRWGTELPPSLRSRSERPHPEMGDELEVVDGPPEGALPNDLPPQPMAFVPDLHPEEIAEIAARLRTDAGLPKEPTGEVNEPAR